MDDYTVLTQIYEIQSPRAAEPLLALGVDHIGTVVLDEKNWKIPELRETVRLVSAGGAVSSLLPLFSSSDTVARALDYYQPAVVHFCEAISSRPVVRSELEAAGRRQQKTRERFPEIKIMRSLPISPAAAGEKSGLLEVIARFEPLTDFFLTDTVLPTAVGDGPEHQPVPGFVGITGLPCDWAVAAALIEATRVPVILAGGLSPDNVYEAVLRTRPAGVDSCTRTNRDDGRGGFARFEKDYEKVKRLVSEARRAERDVRSELNKNNLTKEA